MDDDCLFVRRAVLLQSCLGPGTVFYWVKGCRTYLTGLRMDVKQTLEHTINTHSGLVYFRIKFNKSVLVASRLKLTTPPILHAWDTLDLEYQAL